MSELNSMLSRVSTAPHDLHNDTIGEAASYAIFLEKSRGKWIAVVTDGALPHVIGRASTALGLMVRVWIWTFTRKAGYAADA